MNHSFFTPCCSFLFQFNYINAILHQNRSRLKEELVEAQKAVEESQKQGRTELAQMRRNIQELKIDVAAKEDEVLRLKSDQEWAGDRIQKLEATLQMAASEVKKRTDANEKWEFKAGDQQQQIYELERYILSK